MNAGKVEFEEVGPIGIDGKLSFHSLGRAHIRAHDSQFGHQLVRFGNALLGPTIGVRHLFTAMFAQPIAIGNSAAGARASDVILKAKEVLPFAMVFFAIPWKHLTVQVHGTFHTDDVSQPPDISMGGFGLRQHAIAWLHYRTTHMTRWPANDHFWYGDGFHVPIFIPGPTKEHVGTMRVELRAPHYELEADTLSITI